MEEAFARFLQIGPGPVNPLTVPRVIPNMMVCKAAMVLGTPLVLDSYPSMGVLSLFKDNPSMASRTFDLNRDDFEMGQGLCVLVLKTHEHT